MTIAVNQKSILPVARAADFRGFSIAGLWKRYKREEDGKYSYATFHGVTSGRLRVPEIEEWLEKEGFGDALKEAQGIYEASREATNGL